MTGLDVEHARDRRDRVHRDRLRARDTRRRHRPRRAPRRGRARTDGRLRPRDAHEVRAAATDRERRRSGSTTRRRRCSSTSGATCRSPGPRRCAATASASTADSSIATCASSTTTCTTAASTCRRSKSCADAGIRPIYRKRPGKAETAPRARRHPRVDRGAAVLPRATVHSAGALSARSEQRTQTRRGATPPTAHAPNGP